MSSYQGPPSYDSPTNTGPPERDFGKDLADIAQRHGGDTYAYLNAVNRLGEDYSKAKTQHEEQQRASSMTGLGSSQRAGYYDPLAMAMQGRDPAKSSFAAPQSNMARGELVDAIGMVRNRAQGQGLASDDMLAAALDANRARAASSAASMTGVNPALAQRIAAQQQNSADAQARQQFGAMGLQERAQAQGALTGALAGLRGQDMGLDQMRQRTDLANLQSQNQQAGRNDAMTQALMGMGLQADQAAQQGGIAALGSTDQRYLGNLQAETAMKQAEMEMEAREKAAKWGFGGTLLGGLLGAGGQALAAAIPSDVRLKEDIEPGDQKVSQLLDALKSYKFDYKDSRHGGDNTLGIMAQDLEKTPMGREAVINTPEGKAIDGQRALQLALAANANLNERLRKLEDPRDRVMEPSAPPQSDVRSRVMEPSGPARNDEALLAALRAGGQ